MSGTGADPTKGISKSTVAEWNEQVRDPFFFFIPPYLLNTSLVASQRCRPSLLHHCSHSLCGKEF